MRLQTLSVAVASASTLPTIVVSWVTCPYRSCLCLSRRRPQTRGNAAAFGDPSTRLLPSSFGSVCRSDGSPLVPLVLRSTTPGRIEGRGRRRRRGRGRSGRGRGGGRGRGTRRPDFRDCQNVTELADLAHANLNSLSNRDIAAFWSLLPRLLHKGSRHDPNLEEKLKVVAHNTRNRISSFQGRDLAQTSLGMAKTVSQVSRGSRQYVGGDHRRILRDLLLKDTQYLLLFDSIASSAEGVLNKFDARSLSNLIYSYGLVKYNPDIGGETQFNVFGQAAVKILHTFNSQDISNMLLAFVYVNAKNSMLFRETGEAISGMDLRSFNGQDFANVLWSFESQAKRTLGYSKHLGIILLREV